MREQMLRVRGRNVTSKHGETLDKDAEAEEQTPRETTAKLKVFSAWSIYIPTN